MKPEEIRRFYLVMAMAILAGGYGFLNSGTSPGAELHLLLGGILASIGVVDLVGSLRRRAKRNSAEFTR